MKREIDVDSYFDTVDGGSKTKEGSRPGRNSRHGKDRRDRGRAKDQSTPLPGKAISRYRSVRVKKIIIPETKRDTDYDIVYGIAESARAIGLVYPIAVRKVHVTGEATPRTVLVAGAHRLEAAKHLGHEKIDCKFVDRDDDDYALLVQVAEDLFRKRITVLRRSELTMKWCELAVKDEVSGQVGQKRKRGRPRGGLSELARKLPVDDSLHAKRQIIRRARKIAGITPEAKQAAIAAELDDNQAALLMIAGVSGSKAQLRKIASLAKKPAEDAEKPGTGDAGKETDESDVEVRQRRGSEPEPPRPDTTYEQMVELWDKHCRHAWKYLPQPERDQFIEKLRRARCKAHRDAVAFVKDVFTGRQDVYAADLYRLAKKRGISDKVVRTLIKYHRYIFKRRRDDKRAYYRRRDTDWKNELPKISHFELTGEAPIVRGDDYYDLGQDQPEDADDYYTV